MKIISSKIHGVLDYLAGIFIVFMPYILGFNDTLSATLICIFMGLVIVGYSLHTNYDLGILKKMPIKRHIILDIGSGIFLASTPWLLDFADQVFLPHVIAGSFMLLIGALSSVILLGQNDRGKTSGKASHPVSGFRHKTSHH